MQLFVHLQRVVRFLCLIPRCRQAIRIDVTKKSLTPYTESEKRRPECIRFLCHSVFSLFQILQGKESGTGIPSL